MRARSKASRTALRLCLLGALGAASFPTSACTAPAPAPRQPAPPKIAESTRPLAKPTDATEPVRTGELAARYPALLRADDVTVSRPAVRFAAVAAEYQRSFAAAAATAASHPDALAALSSEDLDALFGAAERMSAYFVQPRYASTMAAALAELERRGEASPKHVVRLASALVQNRELPDLRALQIGHPTIKLPAVPTISSSNRAEPPPYLWVPVPNATDDAPAFQRRSIDVTRDAQILVVANPFCRFALAAVAAIAADAQLAPIFNARSTWLTPQDGFFAIDEANAWNRAHPALPLAFSVQRRQWPLIDDWATPTFYFLQHGKLVAKVSGWPRGGQRDELVTALHQLGLL